MTDNCPNCGGTDFDYVIWHKFCKSCDIAIDMTEQEAKEKGVAIFHLG